MLGATRRALSFLPNLEAATPPNGQDSVAKLVYAPLAFLSFRSETNTLAGILASAVAFLEGYSPDEMETELEFVQKDSTSVVARSHLKLVPYRTTPPALEPMNLAPSVTAAPALRIVSTAAAPKTVFHEVSLSAVNSDTLTTSDTGMTWQDVQLFEKYKSTFQTAPLFCDRATQSLLETTSSPHLARAVFRCFSETGLVAQPEVLLKMMERLETTDEHFLRAVIAQLEAECDLGLLHFPSPVAKGCQTAPTSWTQEPSCELQRHKPGRFDVARARRQRTQ